jgi:uncharacterized protein YciI
VSIDLPGASPAGSGRPSRERHLAQAASTTQVTAVFGTAILDDGAMIGSMLVMAADSRAALDSWLRVEPYVVDDVWREVRVHQCQIGPSFLPSGIKSRREA